MIGNDITKIDVNPLMPKEQRILKFLSDIENPYSYHCGDAIINIRFDESAPPLQHKLFSLIQRGKYSQ